MTIFMMKENPLQEITKETTFEIGDDRFAILDPSWECRVIVEDGLPPNISNDEN